MELMEPQETCFKFKANSTTVNMQRAQKKDKKDEQDSRLKIWAG